jgi:hypothetical protein
MQRRLRGVGVEGGGMMTMRETVGARGRLWAYETPIPDRLRSLARRLESGYSAQEAAFDALCIGGDLIKASIRRLVLSQSNLPRPG